jgi:hypothetical protein
MLETPARVILLYVIAVTFGVYGCAADTGEVHGAAPGESGRSETVNTIVEQTVRLRPGESIRLEAETLEVGFEGVSGDSRCAKGETCVWEGDANVRVWLQAGDGAKVVRELHTSARSADTDTATDYAGWTVGLDGLAPYPVAGRAIAPADYVATLRITRGMTPQGELD